MPVPGRSAADVVIVAATRSAVTRAGRGGLAGLRTDALAAQVVAAALAQVPALPPGLIEDLYLGCALPGGEQGFNLGRVVAVLLGLDRLPAATVTRYCASSLQAVRMAAHAIRAREGRAFIVAGAESSSSRPRGHSDSLPGTKNPVFAAAEARTAGAPARERWRDPRAEDLLPDVYVDVNRTAENIAGLYGIARAEQDEYAVLSHRRARDAIAAGVLAAEITPVACAGGTVVRADDGPRADATPEGLAALPPLLPDGTVTAGTCCKLADGAAALILTDRALSDEHGLPVLATVRGTGVAALSPELMGLGTVPAVRRALRHSGLALSDIDLLELNEEYAVQLLANQRDLGVPVERLNVHGGALALGHPFGMTGIRMICTLLGALRRNDASTGLVATPAGGGQGMAVVVARES
ncbi:acetyl-CoA C-acyltransferase [Dactylosporangium sp. CA-139114]|uniref:acetyl-CoA C-acyltransferase n=1 Tax=Dactylosporangium sp. CA-139114 TaxID=3239931 RepID=UPI003D97E127